MIAIVNYGLGNLTSILNMCKHLGVDAVITADYQVLQSARLLILPGVGHFKKGMDNLIKTGLKELLDTVVLQDKKPILGICLGAQLMTMHSEEGEIDGLQWVPARTVRFDTEKMDGLKVPHMGWSDIQVQDQNPLWQGLPQNPRFYHVHTYHFVFDEPNQVSATAKYGYEFACAFQHENIFGVQFHPEKSHKYGMKVLQNFFEL